MQRAVDERKRVKEPLLPFQSVPFRTFLLITFNL